jgi:hypothetical protein
LTRTKHSRIVFIVLLAGVAGWTAGCTAAFGPGYQIVAQEITVQFVPSPEPTLRVNAEYHLRNTGNQTLTSLEVRLPGRRRFHFVNPQALWDAAPFSFDVSPANPRDVLLVIPKPWTVSSSHTLRLSVDFQPAGEGENSLSFAPDAFFLPAQGWSPELLPAPGVFGNGGVPPKAWNLIVRVPGDFLVHVSGQQTRGKSKASHNSSEQVLKVVQQGKDAYPFVIAGRFSSTQQKVGGETVNLWTRSPQKPDALRDPAAAMVRVMRAYDQMFGARARDTHQLWIVECPTHPGCFTRAASSFSSLIFEGNQSPSAEMVSLDTVMVNLAGGAPAMATVAPSLASSWLGYDRNPGFFQQSPPLSFLPAFAAARGREAVDGAAVRAEIIRRVLRGVPAGASAHRMEDDSVLRAKSLLFFYGLQDRFGAGTFDKALSHMLYARAGRGFDLDDLIAALEEETHQNVAEFVRSWMKHPGVPEEFRARYETPSAATSNVKETP